MSSLDLFLSAGVAVAVGLLIGAERERSKRQVGSAGVRTFAVVALLGNIATLLHPVVGGVVLASVGLVVAVEYAGARKEEPGLTSEVALLATMGLGALTRFEPALAAAAGVAVAVLLASKASLHHFVRDTVTDLETTDALKFFVIAFIVLPLLPTDPIGPYGVLVPRRIWLLVVLITGIGWLGYAATRALGARRGLVVAGLAGGFVSGTATIGAMAAKARAGAAPRHAALAGALMASVATLVQVAVLVTIADRGVAAELYVALAAGALVLAVEAWWLGRKEASSSDHPAIGRPFALVPALVIAAVISAVLLLSTWLNQRYGASGTMLAAATGSLADTHAAAVAVATLAHAGEVSVSLAVAAIGLGLLTNTVSKVVAALVGGGGGFAARVLAWHLPAVAAVGAVLWLTL